jgi:hypothetical protein
MFRRVSAAEWKIAVDDAVIVSTDTRVLKLPTKAQSAVELINSGEPFPVTAFANWLDAPGRAVLVRRFLREGLIEPHAA